MRLRRRGVAFYPRKLTVRGTPTLMHGKHSQRQPNAQPDIRHNLQLAMREVCMVATAQRGQHGGGILSGSIRQSALRSWN